jgi:hypothetical protein
MNCWEFKTCGINSKEPGICLTDNGNKYAHIAGTMCGGKVQGTFGMKLPFAEYFNQISQCNNT